MTESWTTAVAGDFTALDRVRVANAQDGIATGIETDRLVMQRLVALIEETPSRGFEVLA